jgi:hypothetical protein
MRRRKPENALRGKLNLTMHPEVRQWADEIALKRRRSISQLFEDLVEAEWQRQNQPQTPPAPPAPAPTPVTYAQPQPYPAVPVQMPPYPMHPSPYGTPQGY